MTQKTVRSRIDTMEGRCSLPSQDDLGRFKGSHLSRGAPLRRCKCSVPSTTMHHAPSQATPEEQQAAIRVAGAAARVLLSALRLLEPGGWLVLVDLHPAGPWLKLPQQLFCALFETDTATAMLEDDLPTELEQLGFSSVSQELLAGRALQRITATRPR